VRRLTSLLPGKTYYVRAYATNVSGTGYGDILTFSTLASVTVPTVNTTVPSGILNKSAKTGGEVTLWAEIPLKSKAFAGTQPEIRRVSDSKTVDGNDVGAFTSYLINLSPSTKYFVRAYATNSAGTGYGIVDTFITQSTARP